MIKYVLLASLFCVSHIARAQLSIGFGLTGLDDSQFLKQSHYSGSTGILQSEGSFGTSYFIDYKKGKNSYGLIFRYWVTRALFTQTGSVVGMFTSYETDADSYHFGASYKRWILESSKMRIGLGVDYLLSHYNGGLNGGGTRSVYYTNPPSQEPRYYISANSFVLQMPGYLVSSFLPHIQVEADVSDHWSVFGQLGAYLTVPKPFYFTTITLNETYTNEAAWKTRLDNLSGGTYTGLQNVQWPVRRSPDYFRDIRPNVSLGVKYTFRRKARGTPDMGS